MASSQSGQSPTSTPGRTACQGQSKGEEKNGRTRLTLLSLLLAKQPHQRLLHHLGLVRRHGMLPVLRVEGVEGLGQARLLRIALLGGGNDTKGAHDGEGRRGKVRRQRDGDGDGEVLRPAEALRVDPRLLVCSGAVSSARSEMEVGGGLMGKTYS
jgi:hypothetical protein